MIITDSVRELLCEFFGLPLETPVEALSQSAIGEWDSLAMVQLITELQSTYSVQFELDEIEHLGSYEQIRQTLERKGAKI